MIAAQKANKNMLKEAAAATGMWTRPWTF